MGRKVMPEPRPVNGFATVLNLMAEACNHTSVLKGFEKGPKRSFGDIIALIHSELSEALEEYRNGHEYQEIYFNTDNIMKPEGIPIELADAIIRILQFCANNGIDIGNAVAMKMEYNTTRPFKHGGKVI
jgi:hypothetical protein